MKKIFSLFFILTFSFLYADNIISNLINKDNNENNEQNITLTQDENISNLEETILTLRKNIQDNILIKRYNSYLAYRKIATELDDLKADYAKYSKYDSDRSKELAYQLNNKIQIRENELELLSEYKDSPIGKLIKPHEIEVFEPITNPFGIINGLSYVKKLNTYKVQFKGISQELTNLLTLLNEQISANEALFELNKDEDIKTRLDFLKKEKHDFEMVLDIVKTTDEVYSRKIEQTIIETQNQIENQVEKSIKIAVALLVLFFISFIIKLALKKYFSQNENYYMTNKIINFTLVILMIFIILFSYIDNVSYLVTILGFASAGIAIALKDWFMSIFGWMVIVTSGSIHVGDRIKVTRNGVEVVGDVLDISLFKITIREDVTLTSYLHNRRSGRIFFIPNNYIFSEMIANYSHGELKTVWDGIDITITFDSNYKKAQHLAKEILKHYSKGYTDITRKQLSKMRSRYALRATGVEPRVYTFVEPYGIVISSWYLTNSYAALALRSTISPEIIEAFLKEDDIKIAYPTQTININKDELSRDLNSIAPILQEV